jgi:hypothetical protein
MKSEGNMIEYHKIQSVYLRDPATQHRTFLMGQFSEPAFAYLANNEWVWTEKIDGTNVRVNYVNGVVRFGGRTNDAQMPVFLMERLQSLFTAEKMAACFPDFDPSASVFLFGEGYGAKIQKPGGRYRASCDFILFDVMVGGVYLERHNVIDVAEKLGIEVVPEVGRGTLLEAVEFTRAGYKSPTATDATLDAEGLVLRPACELTDRRGHRVITKIKARDFALAAVAA